MLSIFIKLLGYCVSFLPGSIRYRISRLGAWILGDIVQYRKKVINDNLHNSFPDLSEKQLLAYKKKFYHVFCDQILEMLLMVNKKSYESIKSNYEIDLEGLRALYAEGRNVMMILGHQFNWEWGLWILSKETDFHVQGVYMPVKNKALDAFWVSVRGAFGAEMISAHQVKPLLLPNTNKPTLTLIIGDQSPSNLDRVVWLNFLNQSTAFIQTYEKIARKRAMAVVFIEVIRKSNGHYHTPYIIHCKDARETTEGSIVNAFAKFLEGSIRRSPENWLWSHRRWKHKPPVQHSPLQ